MVINNTLHCVDCNSAIQIVLAHNKKKLATIVIGKVVLT